MSHWWHTDRTGDREHVAKKGNPNASEKQSATPVNGDSGTSPGESLKEESGRPEDESQSASRLRGDEREEIAPVQAPSPAQG